MKTFHYPLNHKADEAYMARMCHQGWAATRLVEGVWTFEPCRPDQYVYRVGYLRGKSRAEVAALKAALAARGIAFVSRYSFWAIFRSEQDTRCYRMAGYGHWYNLDLPETIAVRARLLPESGTISQIACSPFGKRVHDPNALYDAYDESDDTAAGARAGLLPGVGR